MEGVRTLSDAELLRLLGGDMVAGQAVRELAWRSVGELRQLGVGEVRAAAFELGRRGGWAPPQRGDRCDGPERVAELMRSLAHAPVEQFHVSWRTFTGSSSATTTRAEEVCPYRVPRTRS